MTRAILIAAMAILGLAASARADTYALVNPTGNSGAPCTVSTIVYDGVSPYQPPAGLSLTPSASAPAACPPPPNPTVIAGSAFVLRVQNTLGFAGMTALFASTDPGVKAWLSTFQLYTGAGGTVDLSNPNIIAGINYLVSPATGGSLMTSAQAAAILTP